MIELFQFSILRPVWILALPVIIGLAYKFRKSRSGIGDWETVVDPALMNAMRALGRVQDSASRTTVLLPFIAAAFIAVALSGLAVQKRDAQAFRNLDGVIFVMDTSDSLIKNPAWQEVVTVGRIGINALGSKPAGLIVYAGDAYIASDMTADSRQIGITMSLLDENTVPDKGSRPALALEMAALILRQARIIAGDVVLLTDGAGLDADANIAAKEIAAMGARLTIVHASTDENTERHSSQLSALASLGNGSLLNLKDSDALAEMLASNTYERLQKQDYQLMFWTDYGRYLLLLAMIPLLGVFRERISWSG